MSNREIRSRAWALFRVHYRGMLPAMAAVAATTSAPVAAYFLFARIGILPTAILLAVPVLLSPVGQYGSACLARAVLSGETPGFPRLYAPLGSIRQVARIWLAALIQCAPLALFIPWTLQFKYDHVPISQTAWFLYSTISFFLCLLWMPPLSLFSHAAARKPEGRALGWLRASHRALGRDVGRAWKMYISTLWPVQALTFAFLVLDLWVRYVAGIDLDIGCLRLIPMAAVYLLCVFYGAYPLLALSALAEELFSARSILPEVQEGE